MCRWWLMLIKIKMATRLLIHFSQDSNDTSDDNVNLPPGPTSQVVVDLTEPDPTSTSVVSLASSTTLQSSLSQLDSTGPSGLSHSGSALSRSPMHVHPSTNLGLQSTADNNSQGERELQEFRRIRYPQDLAYEESLAIDREREENARRKALRKQELANLRNGLKPKFETVENSQDFLVIGLRLPDGRKIERNFSGDDLTKTLYKFAFCVGEINDDFSIETVVPRRIIPCSSVETLVQCGINCSCLLTVSYASDVDILQSLSEGKQQEWSKEESFTSVLEKADERREQYASEKFQQPARVRMISRSNIFDHVMDLFSDESFLKEYPLHIKFEGEIAVDLGGVH